MQLEVGKWSGIRLCDNVDDNVSVPTIVFATNVQELSSESDPLTETACASTRRKGSNVLSDENGRYDYLRHRSKDKDRNKENRQASGPINRDSALIAPRGAWGDFGSTQRPQADMYCAFTATSGNPIALPYTCIGCKKRPSEEMYSAHSAGYSVGGGWGGGAVPNPIR